MRSVLAITAAFLAVAVAACGGGGGDDELTIYSGREKELIGELIDEIEQRQGEPIAVRYGETPQLAVTIIEEGGDSPADIFFSQDAGALGALDQEGLLMRLPDDVLAEVPARFRAKDGRWIGTSGRARVIAYGEDVKRSDLPPSVLGLTDPKWQGRIGWAPTNGSFEAFVTAMRVTEGEDTARNWLEGMVANDAQEYPDNSAIRDAIAAGEIDVGLINHYYVAQAKKEDPDYPVDIYFPPNDVGSMINAAGVGVLKSTEHEERALDFVRDLLTRPSQKYLAEGELEYPLVPGVPTDPALVPLSQIPDPGVDLSSIGDLEGTLRLLQETGAL
ncbi:MAG TPA: iron ABC transporter substrate-binding protein [Solirubrobacterales bacterium]|nr:iron ABC transporter substrate-binding protein [Solirubrobacterales bacterium]